MTTLDIRAARKTQKESNFPEITAHNFEGEVLLYGVSILEAGMVSGEASVGFILKTDDGKYFLAQTSAGIIKTLAKAIEGWEQNWKENPE